MKPNMQPENPDYAPIFPEMWLNDDFTPLYDDVKKCLNDVSGAFYRTRDGKVGTAGFSHNFSVVVTRIKDVHLILKRLAEERRQLAVAHWDYERSHAHMEIPPGQPYPDEVAQKFLRTNELREYIELDMETLYQFGAILLDHWSAVIAESLNLDLKLSDEDKVKGKDFHNLVKFLESSRCQSLHAQIYTSLYTPNREDIHWLHMQFRLFRNKFIVHRTKPFQRGTIYDVHQGEFKLHSAIATGALTDESLSQLHSSLVDILARGPSMINRFYRDGKMSLYESKDRLVECSHELSLRDRDELIKVAASLGFCSPTFHYLGTRLFGFIVNASKGLVVLLESDNLGKAASSNE